MRSLLVLVAGPMTISGVFHSSIPVFGRVGRGSIVNCVLFLLICCFEVLPRYYLIFSHFLVFIINLDYDNIVKVPLAVRFCVINILFTQTDRFLHKYYREVYKYVYTISNAKHTAQLPTKS